ncbi:PAS domain S-box protein [Ideonella sp.]|uniref:PAS domain-containing hybrid sensor histidine kinase/response regulator n=1 Tax=Ideonella sp. TaxID=1929293 RepID=UPI002B49FB9B|nr:PAS domain S-box protein [Ideonella sp.]HJV70754.1 PAS domain S-box protein [Ideonella sp.]
MDTSHSPAAGAGHDPAAKPVDPLTDAVRQRAEVRVGTPVRPADGSAAEVDRLVHEWGVQQAELEMQNAELRQAQRALELSRDHYLQLYARAPVGYVTLDAQGGIVDLDDTAAMLLGRAHPDMPGHLLAEFVDAPDRERLQRYQAGVVRGDPGSPLELKLAPDGGGAGPWVMLDIVPQVEPARQPTRCRAALIDITERLRMRDGAARLAAIVASSEDAIVSRDLDGRIDSWNDGAARLFSHAAEEMVGATMDALVPEELRAQEAGLLWRLRDGETVAHLETERMARGGVRVPVSMSLSPIRDERGAVVGSALIARDISERRRADRALRERVRQLDVLSQAGQALILGEQDAATMRRELFERVRAAVGSEICLNYGTSDDGESLLLLSAYGLSEAHEAELARVPIGGSLTGLVARRGEKLVIENMQQCGLPEAARLKAAGVRCFAGYPLLAHGRDYGVAAFASTSRDRFRRGDVLVIKTLCDQLAAMLERSRLMAELRASERTLKRADKAKDDLIATLAHELRNPLAPIRNALGILRRADDVDRARIDWCRDIIERQVVQMTHLLEDLLDASRLVRNKIELRVERLELARVIGQAVEAAQPLMHAQRHRLRVVLPDAPIVVHGDLTRLTQVFANLLNNAAKYSDAGSEIVLAAERASGGEGGGGVRVSVRDPGIGIAPEQLPVIFEMFAQLRPALERAGGGLGIGLALARGLVEQHGGTLQAASDGPGRGSEFTVWLPVGQGEAASAARHPGAEGGPELAPHRVLVVDDNVDAAQTLAAMLSLHGQDVRTAFGGLEALEVAAQWRPDAAVLDIGMPGLNGYELCQRLRAQARGHTPLLIACTGWGQEADRDRAHDAGFDFHLVKPIEPAVLLRLLATLDDEPPAPSALP